MKADDLPALIIGEYHFEPNGMPVLLVWGNRDVSRFLGTQAAKSALLAERYIKKHLRSEGAQVFVWNGEEWKTVSA
jgi:hypothetical protein